MPIRRWSPPSLRVTRRRDGDEALRITIVEPLGTGGMSHYAYQLAGALSAEGADVTLLTSTDYELRALPHSFTLVPRLRLWPHDSRPAAEGASCAAHARPLSGASRFVRRLGRGGRLVRAWVELTRYLLRTRPDIVQFGLVRYPFEGAFLWFLRRRGLLLADVCHEFELRERSRLLSSIYVLASGRIYRNFDVIFVHGERSRADFGAAHPEHNARTAAIPHGNEDLFLRLGDADAQLPVLRERYEIHPGDQVVLFFGNLVPSKGVADLVRAHAIVCATRPVILLVAGYPSKLFDTDALRALIADLGFESSVRLALGYVPNDEVAALMQLADVVVLPYRKATQSGALHVACSCGRPIVATDVGALSEAIENGRTGLLVPTGSPVALAGAIEEILADPAKAAEMGERARVYAETLAGWGTIARAVLATYSAVLRERS